MSWREIIKKKYRDTQAAETPCNDCPPPLVYYLIVIVAVVGRSTCMLVFAECLSACCRVTKKKRQNVERKKKRRKAKRRRGGNWEFGKKRDAKTKEFPRHQKGRRDRRQIAITCNYYSVKRLQIQWNRQVRACALSQVTARGCPVPSRVNKETKGENKKEKKNKYSINYSTVPPSLRRGARLPPGQTPKPKGKKDLWGTEGDKTSSWRCCHWPSPELASS